MWKKFVDVIDLGCSLFVPYKFRKQLTRLLYPKYIKRLQAKKRGFGSLDPIR